jgi:hypothetical protein
VTYDERAGERARRTTALLDVVVPVVLTLLALSALEGSYADRSYLVVGGLGALVAASVAVVAWTQGRGRGELLLALLVLFAPVGALFSRHGGDVVTIPGIDSMSAVLTDGFTGPAQLLGTIPPADPVGAPLTLTFILGYVVAAAATGSALYSRRAVLPALPALLGLVVAILLGVQDPAGIAQRSIAFAVVALTWCAARGRRRVQPSATRVESLRRLVAAALVVGAVVAAVWVVAPPVTSVDDPRWVLRGHVGRGEDTAGLDNPLGNFRRYTRQLPGTPGNVFNEVLLDTEGLPPGVPLRFATLDVYDGTQWYAGNRTVPDRADSLFLRIGSEVDAPLPGEAIDVSVVVRKAYVSGWLPLAGQLTSLDFTFADGRAQRDDVRYNPATLSALVKGGMARRDDYEFSAVVPQTELKVGMVPYSRARSQPAGAFLDQALAPWRDAALSPMERIFSLADYLRTNGRFSDGAQSFERQFVSGHDELRLGTGFFEADQMVGDHEQYTAFMALAANRLGVPARAVVGAVPGSNGIVRGSDVTSWVEIRVKDGSWRILPSDVYLSTRPPKRREPPKRDPGSFVAEAEKDRQETSKPPQQEPARDPVPDVPEQPASRTPLVLGLAVLALLGAAAVPTLKGWRRLRRRTRGRADARLDGAWQELVDLLTDLGVQVAPTPRPTQARELGRAAELSRLADQVFAPDPPAEDAVAAAWRHVATERAALLREHGWRGRVRAYWNPRSLRLVARLRTGARRALSTPAPPAAPPGAGGDVRAG